VTDAVRQSAGETAGLFFEPVEAKVPGADRAWKVAYERYRA